jgi:hypothetical protein
MTHTILNKLRKKWRRWIGLILLVTMIPILSGCYGYFPLTKAVYRYNGDVTYSKVLRTLLFWGLVIIPVYGVSTIADALVFNLIEFWTGNVLHVSNEYDKEGSKVTLKPLDNGNSAELTVLRNNEIVSQLRFMRVSDNVFEVYDNNKLSGMVVQTSDGDLEFTDREGQPIQTIKADDIKALSPS